MANKLKMILGVCILLIPVLPLLWFWTPMSGTTALKILGTDVIFIAFLILWIYVEEEIAKGRKFK